MCKSDVVDKPLDEDKDLGNLERLVGRCPFPGLHGSMSICSARVREKWDKMNCEP